MIRLRRTLTADSDDTQPRISNTERLIGMSSRGSDCRRQVFAAAIGLILLVQASGFSECLSRIHNRVSMPDGVGSESPTLGAVMRRLTRAVW